MSVNVCSVQSQTFFCDIQRLQCTVTDIFYVSQRLQCTVIDILHSFQ